MKLPKIYGYLNNELNGIEQYLEQVVQAEHPVLRRASTELLQAGGKRIRPVFVLLSSQMGGSYDFEKIKAAASSLELIHMATLVHDDVIDNSELRRGKPTIKKLYGDQAALYTGDYILAKALEEATSIENPMIHQVLSKTIVEVSIGEIEQIKDKFNWEQGLRNYLRRIKRKTALLIATSCKLGALIADLEEKEVRKLYQYGYNIGMSYQIIDDILDFTSTPELLGKPVGNDLLQGNVTIPILFAMEDPGFKQLVKTIFEEPMKVSPEGMNELIQALKKTDSIERSYQLSNQYLEKALDSLEGFPKKKAKYTLETIAKYIGKRRS